MAFERHGLAGTSVNSIIAEAGVAHGTFYLYWTGRAAVFTTLVHQAGTAVRDRFDALLWVRTVAELTAWLASWLEVIARHGVTLHTWTSETAGNPGLQSLDMEMRPHLERVIRELPDRTVRPHDLPPGASAIALWTILMDSRT
jgi:AcrR family transcriptional regulator